jgi:hypothetical protein
MLSSPGSGGCESAARLGGYRLALEEVATRFRHFHRISLRPGVTREFLQLDPSRFLDRDSNKCAIPGDDIARGVGVLVFECHKVLRRIETPVIGAYRISLELHVQAGRWIFTFILFPSHFVQDLALVLAWRLLRNDVFQDAHSNTRR